MTEACRGPLISARALGSSRCVPQRPVMTDKRSERTRRPPGALDIPDTCRFSPESKLYRLLDARSKQHGHSHIAVHSKIMPGIDWPEMIGFPGGPEMSVDSI